MKLTVTQQKLVDRMKAENLIIEVNHGMGISAKTRVTLVTTDINIVPNSTVPYGTFQSLLDKGAIVMSHGNYKGITRHYYRLA